MTWIQWDLRNLPRYGAGCAAIAICIFLLFREHSFPHLLASVFLILICITDTARSKIPNLFNLALIVAGFGYQVYSSGASGISTAFLGMVLGFSLLFPFYLLGGMGAGDVKALAALGALFGPWSTLNIFLYMGLIGGVLACLHYAFNRSLTKKLLQGLGTLKTFAYTRDAKFLKPEITGEKLRFPYASAIAFGFFAYLTWGSLIELAIRA